MIPQNLEIYNGVLDRLKGDAYSVLRTLSGFLDSDSFSDFLNDITSKLYKNEI